LILSVVCGTPVARADDRNGVDAKLAKARLAYSEATTSLREKAAAELDAREEAERRRSDPNLGRLKAIATERAALKRGTIPAWIDGKEKAQWDKARRSLVAALIEVKAASVQAREDEKAAAIEKEIQELKKNPRAGAGTALDDNRPKFLVNQSSRRVVTVESDRDGAKLFVVPRSVARVERSRFLLIPSGEPGFYYIGLVGTDKLICRGGADDGDVAHIWGPIPAGHESRYKFKLVEARDGGYHLQHKLTGKYLAPPNPGVSHVALWTKIPPDSVDAFRFFLVPAG
jgi:hypothetical protein